ncbi:hypothetical protein Forpi1262_v014454 [Fusarium oxysporum f. sp. raphani]|uniref:Uncharacterized protein n=1 Tax=Fusarium oxysporum f. sp. raphani TaxID=96318 RepID=A0A8J5PLN5_FUSOX|nr:hypothetical protein Forpi1262_v014454 [Fusarium oxysporum f. sp. raphani]
MPDHPIPPTLPANRAEFEAHYGKDPDSWIRYLSEAHAWMAEQEANQRITDRKLVELQVQVKTQQEEISTLQEDLQAARVERSAAMMQRSWVEERLDKKEKELETARDEARQAINAKLPTVVVPTPTTTPTPLLRRK